MIHSTALNSSDNLPSSSRQSSQLRWRLLDRERSVMACSNFACVCRNQTDT